jgi:hypothetical protein
MTSDRPYRKALPVEAALSVLRGGKGTQFHPDVVDTLDRLIAEGGTSRPFVLPAPRPPTDDVAGAPPGVATSGALVAPLARVAPA